MTWGKSRGPKSLSNEFSTYQGDNSDNWRPAPLRASPGNPHCHGPKRDEGLDMSLTIQGCNYTGSLTRLLTPASKNSRIVKCSVRQGANSIFPSEFTSENRVKVIDLPQRKDGNQLQTSRSSDTKWDKLQDLPRFEHLCFLSFVRASRIQSVTIATIQFPGWTPIHHPHWSRCQRSHH